MSDWLRSNLGLAAWCILSPLIASAASFDISAGIGVGVFIPAGNIGGTSPLTDIYSAVKIDRSTEDYYQVEFSHHQNNDNSAVGIIQTLDIMMVYGVEIELFNRPLMLASGLGWSIYSHGRHIDTNAPGAMDWMIQAISPIKFSKGISFEPALLYKGQVLGDTGLLVDRIGLRLVIVKDL